MREKIVLFDIDRTLLDTDKTSVAHNESVLKIIGTTDVEKVKEVKLNYRNTLANEREYDPENYLKLLCEAFKFNKIEDLLDVYYGDKYKFSYENAVYPEVIPLLEKISKDYRLGIYSEGTKKFQNNKFRSMNISKYFEDEIIFIIDAKDTIEAVKRIPDDSIIVDDKEKICYFLTDFGIKAIWLNKKDNRKSDRFTTIFSLSELPAIL